MSQTLNVAIAVVGIDIGKNSVKLGGKGTSATRLVVPNEQTLAGVGGRSLQCH